MKRQQIRKLLLLISLLLFPVTMWYFSPAVIIMGMSQHVLNGSFFVFLAMLLAGIFMGRSFCGYLCPAGGLQECVMEVNPKAAKQGKRNGIKYLIWVVWLAIVIMAFVLGKNDVTIDFFFLTDHGISVAEIYNYIIYYGVILILFVPALLHGRRAACHYLCWMAPFMVIGEKIGQKLHIPQLHVEAKKENCISCKKCNTVCPMGLDVEQMIRENKNNMSTECIQCGRCIDQCPKDVLSFRWNQKNDKEGMQ